MRLLESDIKAMLLNKLAANGVVSSESVVFDELTVGNYSRRVDLAVINSNGFYGFEIKSEADSLTRLQGQVSKYLECFDKVVVVAAEKHVEETLTIVPSNVGVWGVENQRLKVKRRGRKTINNRKSTMLDFLTITDVAKAVSKYKCGVTRTSRDVMISSLLELPASSIREIVYQALCDRFSQTSQNFLTRISGRQVEVKDLDLLSKYKEGRRTAEALKQKKEQLYSDLTAATFDPYLLATAEDEESIFGEIPDEIERLLAV